MGWVSVPFRVCLPEPVPASQSSRKAEILRQGELWVERDLLPKFHSESEQGH